MPFWRHDPFPSVRPTQGISELTPRWSQNDLFVVIFRKLENIRRRTWYLIDISMALTTSEHSYEVQGVPGSDSGAPTEESQGANPEGWFFFARSCGMLPVARGLERLAPSRMGPGLRRVRWLRCRRLPEKPCCKCLLRLVVKIAKRHPESLSRCVTERSS